MDGPKLIDSMVEIARRYGSQLPKVKEFADKIERYIENGKRFDEAEQKANSLILDALYDRQDTEKDMMRSYRDIYGRDYARKYSEFLRRQANERRIVIEPMRNIVTHPSDNFVYGTERREVLMKEFQSLFD